jgi:hypothetical protein
MQSKWDFAGSTDMWSTSASGQLMKVVNLTGFTVYIFNRSCVDTGGSSTSHIRLTPGGSSTSHIHTQTVHIIKRQENNTERGNLGSAGLSPFFANYTLTFALQLRKKHGKPSVMVIR